MWGSIVSEWASLILRWLHVVAAIAWIGSSFYFIALDLSLKPDKSLPDGVQGEAWQVHGGGFYHAQKYLVAPETLPKELREMLPVGDKEKKNIFIKEPVLLKAISDAFVSALAPLRAAGKLGLTVFQYPPWFWYTTADMDEILRHKELMGEVPIAVEFRHGSWLTEQHRSQVFKFLRENCITYITADEPQYATLATVPFLPQVTSDVAYLRLHGRNKETWLKKGVESSARYDYLYSGKELGDFAEATRELSAMAKVVFAMFNNCRLGHAMKNAMEMNYLVGV